MARYIYRQIIFTDNVEKLKDELKNKGGNIFVGEVVDNTGVFVYGKLDSILHLKCGFDTSKIDHISMFAPTINSICTDKYNCVYIHIEDVNNILRYIGYSCKRITFFNLLNSITNKQIYFIIDIKYKDYVFNQIEEYNKHINRLRSFGEIHNQVIFVDDIEKVKQDVSNNKTVMFNELDGSKCKDTRSFYNEVQKQFKFPDYFGRNLDAFNDCMNDYDWESTSSFTVIFNYIKNIRDITLHDWRHKIVIFDILLNGITRAEKVFILIDKKDKDYLFNQIEEYNKHVKRLESFGVRDRQIIIVDDIEKVKQDVNKETEIFNELDGNKCKDIESFYNEIQKQFKFPDYFEHNLNLLNKCINDYSQIDAKIIFNYIKNIKSMLPNNEEERSIFFYILANYIKHTEKIFILIDKEDKDYLFRQSWIWIRKYGWKSKFVDTSKLIDFYDD